MSRRRRLDPSRLGSGTVRGSEPSLQAEPEAHPGAGPPLDLQLLEAHTFECLPGCGLCCYATPAASREELTALLQVETELPVLPAAAGYGLLEARGDGGACSLLADNRCRQHALAPFPCREYPLTVYLGRIVQASYILTCPGVHVRSPHRSPPSSGPGVARREVTRELLAVEHELRQPTAQRRAAAARRRVVRAMREAGISPEYQPLADTELVRRLKLGSLSADWFPVPELPDRDDGIANLPTWRDSTRGIVALADHPGGWELLALSPEGRTPRSLTVGPPVDRPPALDEPARERLREYLEYVLEREATIDFALQATEASGASVSEEVENEIAELAAVVSSRAWLLASLDRRDPEPLTADDVGRGIQASDAEFLDRPVFGDFL